MGQAQGDLFPELEAAAPALKGIGALAAEAERAQERNEVEYSWLESRSTLNSVQSKRVRFEWTINPYRGCEFGCAYCYARYTHEFMELRDPIDFERRIFLKRGAAARLRRELDAGRVKPGQTILIGAATDPYQPAERKFELTRSILQALCDYEGFRIGITTKSDLVVRDARLLKRVARRHRLCISMSVTTTDAQLARRLEPRAVTPQRRLEGIRHLREAGIRIGINLMPVLPGVNDSEEQFEALCVEAERVKAAFVAQNILFLTSSSWPTYRRFLTEHFPHLLRLHESWYGSAAYAPESYREHIHERLSRARERHGLCGWREEVAAGMEEGAEARGGERGGSWFGAVFDPTLSES